MRALLVPAGYCLLSALLLASGCGQERASEPDGETTPPMAFSLRYPQGSHWSSAVAAAQQETLKVWLAALGTREADARSARPAPDDSVSAFVAQAASLDSLVVLEATLTETTEWWRLFVQRSQFRGQTTLRLTRDDTARHAAVVLSSAVAGRYEIHAYAGVASAAGASPPAAPLADGALPAATLLFPIGIVNPAPIDGIEMRFTLSEADSAALYVDPGSRLIVDGEGGAFEIELEPLETRGRQGRSYVLILYPRVSGGAGAEIAVGSWDGILFYLAAFGQSAPQGLWIDPEQAFFSQSQGQTSITPAVYNLER